VTSKRRSDSQLYSPLGQQPLVAVDDGLPALPLGRQLLFEGRDATLQEGHPQLLNGGRNGSSLPGSGEGR